MALTGGRSGPAADAAAVMRSARRRGLLCLIAAGAILCLPIVPLLAGRPPAFLRNLGFLAGPGGTAPAWVLGLLVGALYAGFTIRRIPLVHEQWNALSLAKLLAVVVAVPAAIVEEAFFRRLLMDALLSARVPAAGQILLSGIAFGLAHGVWGIVTGRMMMGVRVMAATGTLGTLLAAVYVIGERSLAPPIVSHFIVTASIQPGIMFAAFSGQMDRPHA